MIDVRVATGTESAAWRDGWRARLQTWFGTVDAPPEWATQQIEGRLSRQAATARDGVTGQDGATGQDGVFVLTLDGAAIGFLSVTVAEQGGMRAALISDLWIDEQHRHAGHGRDAVRWAETWAQSQSAHSIWVSTDPSDSAQAGLFAGYPVRARQMIRRLAEPGQLAGGLKGRAMSEQEFTSWRAELVRGYAADIASSGSMPEAQAAAQAAAETDALLPDGLRTPNQSFLCLCAEDEVVATNWLCHHRGPGVSWVYGVEVSEGHRGKGYGRAAMIIGEQAALNAGDTHLALNVFGHNDVAIGLYNSMGYRGYEDGRSIAL